LAIKLLQDFLAGKFIDESFVESTQDRIVRSLETFFASRRADSLASHYQDLIFSTKSSEVDVSLAVTKSVTLDSCKAQHRRIVENADIEIDCLYSGNVSETDAKAFFASAKELLSKRGAQAPASQVTLVGPDHRRLEVGKETESHFASLNPQEENGAVLMTYQSHIPGFRGVDLSCPESLQSTASLRLISHMLREPLFDTLRTKQQLGYIVSSYYDIEFAHSDATATPVDLLSISILSRKVSPPDVATRIDDFLLDFRSSLLNMPESEIRDHADALSSKMLKPIQSLSSESSTHFAKIRRYSPEILRAGGTDADLPWKSVEDLAGSIRSLQRQDLVQTWDRVVLSKERSRVTSMVYGSTFPLDEKLALKRATSNKSVVVNNTADLLKLRRNLRAYENKVERPSQIARLVPSSTYARLGLAAAAVGVIGLTLNSRRKK
jgi:secreted Zn-dependent insulinase-like peptidase